MSGEKEEKTDAAEELFGDSVSSEGLKVDDGDEGGPEVEKEKADKGKEPEKGGGEDAAGDSDDDLFSSSDEEKEERKESDGDDKGGDEGEGEAEEDDEDVEEESYERRVGPLSIDVVEGPRHKDTEQPMFAKLPNILAIEPTPFDPDPEEVILDEKTENVIRWKWGKDDEGNKIPVSNARLVKWPDGSAHVYIGKEVIQVLEKPIVGWANQLFIRAPKASALVCHGEMTKKLTFQPVSVKSKSHKKLQQALATKMVKQEKVKVRMARVNPEKEKEEKARLEEERIKAMRSRESKQRSTMRSYGMEYTDRYVDDGADDGDLGAIKAAFRGKGKRRKEFDFEEAEKDRRLSSIKDAKRKKDDSSSEGDLSITSSEEEKEPSPPPQSKKKRKAETTNELEDDGDEAVQGSVKRGRIVDSDSDEE